MYTALVPPVKQTAPSNPMKTDGFAAFWVHLLLNSKGEVFGGITVEDHKHGGAQTHGWNASVRSEELGELSHSN